MSGARRPLHESARCRADRISRGTFRRGPRPAPAARLLLASGLLTLSGCTVTDMLGSVAEEEPRTRITAAFVQARDPEAPIGKAEHPQVVAANGGAYEDRRLEALLAVIVAELVAAEPSDAGSAPDHAYRVTILDSPRGQRFRPAGRLPLRHAGPHRARQRRVRGSRPSWRTRWRTSKPRTGSSASRRPKPTTSPPASPLRWSPTAPRAPSRALPPAASWLHSRNVRSWRPTISASAARARPASTPMRPGAFSCRCVAGANTVVRQTARRTAPESVATCCPPILPRPSGSISRARTPAASARGDADRARRDRYLEGIDGLVFGDRADQGFRAGGNPTRTRISASPSPYRRGFALRNKGNAALASGTGPDGDPFRRRAAVGPPRNSPCAITSPPAG